MALPRSLFRGLQLLTWSWGWGESSEACEEVEHFGLGSESLRVTTFEAV